MLDRENAWENGRVDSVFLTGQQDRRRRYDHDHGTRSSKACLPGAEGGRDEASKGKWIDRDADDMIGRW